jgi:hypothetical protein
MKEDAFVDRTGIAVVHVGEKIVAAGESVAKLRPVDQTNVVRYVFPVEVEIIGDDVADGVFDSLRRAFEALG